MFQYVNPMNWLKWSGQFIQGWFLSIPWRQASRTLPALVLMIGLGVAAAIAYTGDGGWRSRQVDQQVNVAFRGGDFKVAELVLRRQIRDLPTDNDLKFKLAMARDELEAKEEAADIMRELVVQARHPQAARWLLTNNYLGKKWPELNDNDRKEFGYLLELLEEEEPKDMGIKTLLAEYLIASERFANAVPILRQLAVVQPMRGLQAAAICRRIGQNDQAERFAEATLEKIEQLFSEEPANPIMALAVVQNQIFLERFEEAVQTLNESIGRMKTPEHRQQLQQAMGDTLVAWINKIESQPNDTELERLRVLKMLQVALQFAPNNPRVLTLVADQVLRTLESDDQNVIAIRNALVQGTSPGIAHFVRGTSYLMKDDAERATRHLKLAAEHLPNSSAILNNLAVAIAGKKDGDLDQALKLIEQAISQTNSPGPYFFETRGQILFRLERFLDAIPDLERALAAPALAVNAHLRLGDCYEKLGEDDLAGDHRSAAETIRKALEAEKDKPAVEPDSKDEPVDTTEPDPTSIEVPATGDSEKADSATGDAAIKSTKTDGR